MDIYQAMMKIDKIFKDAGLDKISYQSQIHGSLVLKYDYWEEVNPVILAEINKQFKVDCMIERDEDTQRHVYIVSARQAIVNEKPHPMDRPNKIGKVKDLLDREENPYG